MRTTMLLTQILIQLDLEFQTNRAVGEREAEERGERLSGSGGKGKIC